MELHNPGFRSRRSYPNLHHVSLAPLTPRFPIDDDPEPTDYFGRRGSDDPSISGNRSPPRSSYISSASVPSTPPILSHSRSTSRTRHPRSKSSTRAGPVSDTNLFHRAEPLPLHRQTPAHKKYTNTLHARRLGDGKPAPSKSDAEWMLRAGIALASSTREEKGQSWLSKRESSTSLVSMPFDDAAAHHRHHHRTKSSASSRKSRSGASTPAAYSRRSSRSRGTSRRGSRAGLSMTTIPPLSSASPTGHTLSPETTTPSPEVSRRSSVMVPDFVDERIRAEMASLQQHERGLSDEESEPWDRDEDESEDEYASDETPDGFDEADLQRLTRERGFGLGSWIDRLVEWTLFGVDEWPAPTSSTATRIGATPTTTTVTFEEPLAASSKREHHDTLSLPSVDGDHSDDEALSYTEGDSTRIIEKPGSQGGWEDASWLFRMVKQTLI
ncbi:hypothetical protein N7512_001027 [Penicillium capsulatum]|nr:hypothetical protein N7512_001027 [Penicillium capsulatum]